MHIYLLTKSLFLNFQGVAESCLAIFLPALVMGNFMVLNLFLALLLNSFNCEELKSRKEVTILPKQCLLQLIDPKFSARMRCQLLRQLLTVASIFDATHIALLSKLNKKCAKDRGAILLWRLKNDAAIISNAKSPQASDLMLLNDLYQTRVCNS